jgi:hypothetical protein
MFSTLPNRPWDGVLCRGRLDPCGFFLADVPKERWSALANAAVAGESSTPPAARSPSERTLAQRAVL